MERALIDNNKQYNMQAENAEIKTYFQNRMAESKKIWATRGPDARQVSINVYHTNFMCLV